MTTVSAPRYHPRRGALGYPRAAWRPPMPGRCGHATRRSLATHICHGPGNTASGDQVMDNFDAAWLGIDAAQAVPGGFNAAGVVRRGASVIATSEARTNTAYGLLTQPDRVSGVVLPPNGLLCIAYHASWAEATATAARAAIFLGANQLKSALAGSAAPAVVEASHGSGAVFNVLSSCSQNGLASEGSGTAYSGDVGTGQVLASSANTADRAGICVVFADPGTYDVSVQFKASSGSVTVKDRKLWVWTVGF